MYKKGRLGPAEGQAPPTPARKVPRTRNCARTRSEPRIVSWRRPQAARTGKWSKKASPKGEGLQFPEKQRNQGLPWVLHLFFLIKTFFKSAQTKPN